MRTVGPLAVHLAKVPLSERPFRAENGPQSTTQRSTATEQSDADRVVGADVSFGRGSELESQRGSTQMGLV